MDAATTVEPIHWCYNREILERLQGYKPAVLIPHPWLLQQARLGDEPGKGTLVVGPPPGPENDRRLWEKIQGECHGPITILVKPRGPYQGSLEFWRKMGYQAACASGPGASHYDCLYQLVASHERVVGCSFSSVLVFAAALGKSVHLLRDYSFHFYEVDRYLEVVSYESPRAREIVGWLTGPDPGRATRECRRILGSELEFSPSLLAGQLQQQMLQLRGGVNPGLSRGWFCDSVLQRLALLLGKPGVLLPGLRSRLLSRPSAQVVAVETNDVDAWLEGIRPDNLRTRRVRYVRGVTEPGMAIDQYA